MAFFPYILQIHRTRLFRRSPGRGFKETSRQGEQAQLHHTVPRRSLRRPRVRVRRQLTHGYRAAPSFYSWIQAGGLRL